MRFKCLTALLLLSAASVLAAAPYPGVEIIQFKEPGYTNDLEAAAHRDGVYLDALHLARLGHLKSQFNFAMMSAIRGETDRAIYWYERAASRNHELSAYNLASMYYHGEGVPVDYERAAFWMTRAAELGYPLAQFELAKMYYEGRGVPQSYEMEAYWYQKAAHNGSAAAAHNLAVMYAKGQGVEQSDSKARKWLEKSQSEGFEERY